MAKDKDKHPSWFKMKLERRELVRQLSPENSSERAAGLLGLLGDRRKARKPVSHPKALRSLRSCRTCEEAWARYLIRVASGAQGGRPKSSEK